METILWIVLGLLVLIVLSALFTGGRPAALAEGFTMPRRTDIGRIEDGWSEEPGYERDLRFTETFTDLQGLGVATDFCRAVQQVGDPGSLQIACAIGRRDGMDTLEYRSRTQREGFRFGRDDYWRKGAHGRMDYCRIVRDDVTGEFYSTCAIAGLDGFKKTEERDTNPPPEISSLLRAYEGVRAWFRFVDDAEDSAGQMEVVPIGKPTLPTTLRPTVSRGAQFNRWPVAAQQAGHPAPPAGQDALRWGAAKTLQLEDARAIRAITFWVWFDAFPTRRAAVFSSSNEGGRKDRVWIGVEGGAPMLPAMPTPPIVEPAQEVRPDVAQAVGPITEPFRLAAPAPPTAAQQDPTASANGIWVYEIWDGEQRLMRLEGPAASASTGRWQHVVLTTTATGANDWWPTWQLWLDGALVATRAEGRQIPAEMLAENILGRDLQGCLMDFRVYDRALSGEDIRDTMAFAKEMLMPNP